MYMLFILLLITCFNGALGDYATVATACRGELESSLPTINSQDEQQFLNKLINKYKIVDSVWLDAGVKDKHIVWTDSTSADYENWIPGRQINNSNCVEMVTDQAHIGQWLDEPCNKKNAYLCKRVVMWSGQRTERLIRDNRRVLDNYMKHTTILLNSAIAIIEHLLVAQQDTDAKIALLEQTKVPIGFIYTQLPDQADPKTLWPTYTWSDVTATYAGQFFRAEGSGSLAFGKGVQAENSPRLSNVHYESTVDYAKDITLIPGEWSKYIYSGSEITGATDYFLKFWMTGGEVRPRNQAVRIFRRVK
ncbi:unnamed protein product [Medioppia subpectinata]|uniref:C-type lectin domain-containing protein n=1 Tax=Medioppia subpectinata TaxID=1979941 RepID=A0A7R9L3I9_9ACAR|nr:unnamed protein product [Medioppia subpectinata]CAG2114635.1 unnamed protein product [Medioppia subpectinata]